LPLHQIVLLVSTHTHQISFLLLKG